MGLFDRFTSSEDDEEPSESEEHVQMPDLVLDDPSAIGMVDGEYQGDEIELLAIDSPNKQWRFLYGMTDMDQKAPVVLLDENFSAVYAKEFGHAINADISNDGTVAITDRSDPFDVDYIGRFVVMDSNGNEIANEQFDSSLSDCIISSDGKLAAALEYRDICIFDTISGEMTGRYEGSIARPEMEFEGTQKEATLYLLNNDRERAIGIDASGDVVWRGNS
ncbi:hypothetical protein [Natronosalvus vescus]|uniref:hypothetical protein n=1 Tax=Natronosalvus vescus TaxID=2953881 RepID=UPI0020912E06|nr:hypothetical protein [Natronosalvus vescus]